MSSESLTLNGILKAVEKKFVHYEKKLGIRTEKKAAENLMFHTNAHMSMILLPLYFGLIAYLFRGNAINVDLGQFSLRLTTFQENNLFTYALFFKIGILVILTYYVTYHWTEIKRDNTYGYWLASGVDRMKFFIYVILGLLSNLIFSMIFGLIIVNSYNSQIFTLGEFVIVIALIISNMIFLTGLAFFVSESINHPEASGFIFALISAISISNTNYDSISNKLFLSELHYNSADTMLILIFSNIIGITLILLSYFLHRRKDINL